MAIKKIEVLEDQTIYDIATRYYGSVEGVFQIIADNPGVDLETDLPSGKMLKIDDDKVVDESVREYFERRKIKPANGGGNDPLVGAFDEGFSNRFQTDNK